MGAPPTDQPGPTAVPTVPAAPPFSWGPNAGSWGSAQQAPPQQGSQQWQYPGIMQQATPQQGSGAPWGPQTGGWSAPPSWDPWRWGGARFPSQTANMGPYGNWGMGGGGPPPQWNSDNITGPTGVNSHRYTTGVISTHSVGVGDESVNCNQSGADDTDSVAKESDILMDTDGEQRPRPPKAKRERKARSPSRKRHRAPSKSRAERVRESLEVSSIIPPPAPPSALAYERQRDPSPPELEREPMPSKERPSLQEILQEVLQKFDRVREGEALEEGEICEMLPGLAQFEDVDEDQPPILPREDRADTPVRFEDPDADDEVEPENREYASFRRHLVEILRAVGREPGILRDKSEQSGVPVPESELDFKMMGVRKDKAARLAWPHMSILDGFQKYYTAILQKQPEGTPAEDPLGANVIPDKGWLPFPPRAKIGQDAFKLTVAAQDSWPLAPPQTSAMNLSHATAMNVRVPRSFLLGLEALLRHPSYWSALTSRFSHIMNRLVCGARSRSTAGRPATDGRWIRCTQLGGCTDTLR